ncbi:MAG: hypothetical protein ACI85K_001193 [Hyphomicrobiaceae bacterium]|jgi:hypothetical protein
MSEAFLERDFKAYERDLQKDPEFNALRLGVRRKLKGIADRVQKAAKPLGTDLSAQAGLHHPYTFNAYRVKEQRAYLCRGAKERKKLATFFGEALGKDAETHYIQTVLEVCIDDQIVEAALRIHPQAWWDGENLKKKLLNDSDEMDSFCQMLKALPPGFNLKLHDWRPDNWCASLKPSSVTELMQHYTPGEHWLHIRRQLPKEDALELGDEAESWVSSSMLSLLPVYKSILWTP